MPNDCENKLIIRGTYEDLEIFVKTHLKQNEHKEWFLDFNTIIPEPTKRSECDRMYVMSNGETRGLELCKGKKWFDWYRWRLDNWNTKWGAYDCVITENDDLLVIYFSTAWTPCKPIINKLIEMYPSLTFDYAYYECGCMLGGYIIGHGGRTTVNHECYDSELKRFAIEYEFECEDSEVD